MTGVLSAAVVSLPLVLPGDGAADVPTNAHILVAPEDPAAFELEVDIDGALVDGDLLVDGCSARFVPREDLAANAEVHVVVLHGGAFLGELTFTTGAGPVEPPADLPEVRPVLRAELVSDEGPVPLWSLRAEAEQPDASPFGTFQVAYAVTSGTEEPVDALWAAQEGPAEGSWHDRAAGWYCAAVGFVDVAGNHSQPVEVCTDLPALDDRGCAATPWVPTHGLLTFMGVWAAFARWRTGPM